MELKIIDPQTGNVIETHPVKEYVRSVHHGHRLCTVGRVGKDGGVFIVAIENPESSGRKAQDQMLLTEDSMLALVDTVFLYYQHKGIDIGQRMLELVNQPGKDPSYEFWSEEEDGHANEPAR